MTKVVGVRIPPPAPVLTCCCEAQHLGVMAHMQVTETISEGLKKEFKVIMDAAELEGKLKERLAGMQGTVQLPGFRPGKVPVELLRQRFGPSVMGEVVQEAINTGAQEAIKSGDFKPALQPKIEVTSFDEGADLEYTIEIEVLPEIEPGDLSSLKLERLSAEVGDNDIEEQLGKIAHQQRRFTASDEKHKSETGDALRIDFTGTIDGEKFEGGTGTDVTLVLGDSQFVPGFAEQLLGVEKDQRVKVDVTFPEAYHEQLAGKNASFEVEVREIRCPQIVEVDNELASELGLDSLEDLRDAVKEQLEKEYAGLSRARLKRSLLDILANQHKFELPEGLVSQEFEAIWQQVVRDRENGRPDPDLEGRSDDDIKSEFRQIAERRVRLGLLLAEVGSRNNVQVEQEEVQRAIADQARQLPPEQQRQAFEFYRDNPDAAAQLQAPIFEDKVIDFIIEMAEVSSRLVTLEDLVRDPDDEEVSTEQQTKVKSKAKRSKASTRKRAGSKSSKSESSKSASKKADSKSTKKKTKDTAPANSGKGAKARKNTKARSDAK